MQDSHYETILAKQLAMNRQTLAVLQKHGVTDERTLHLDFSYNAASRESAESLCALLREQTDYEVNVKSSGSFLRRKWRVEGRTWPAPYFRTRIIRQFARALPLKLP